MRPIGRGAVSGSAAHRPPRPLALHLAASRSRSPSPPAAESPTCTLRSSPTPSAAPCRTLHPTEPLQALAASLRTPQPRPVADCVGNNGRKAPPQRPPCTPSQIREPICCQRPHGLISELSGCGWTDNQGPTASHQVATWAVDGIHAVEDCARSNRGAPGCKSRELSTTVLR